MNKANSENFRRQAEQASISHFMQMAIIEAYRKAYPDKVTIIQDDVTFQDYEHFQEWANKKG